MIDSSTNAQISSECPAFAKPLLAEVPLGSVPISEVYLMDCVEGMKHYPDKYFDLAVVDPPYGIGADKKNAHSSIRDNDLYKDADWDIKPQLEYFIELFRVSKEQIIWGGNYFLDFLPSTQCFLIWNKPERNFSLADAELAWTSFNKSTRCFDFPRNKGERIHPTQKPIELYDFCFKRFATEGMKILDTHLGSGSSRISANKNKLNFVGFEIDEEYFNKQNKRYVDFSSQTRLF